MTHLGSLLEVCNSTCGCIPDSNILCVSGFFLWKRLSFKTESNVTWVLWARALPYISLESSQLFNDPYCLQSNNAPPRVQFPVKKNTTEKKKLGAQSLKLVYKNTIDCCDQCFEQLLPGHDLKAMVFLILFFCTHTLEYRVEKLFQRAYVHASIVTYKVPR